VVPFEGTNGQPRKNVGANMSQQSLKVLFYGVIPVVAFLLAAAGHLFLN